MKKLIIVCAFLCTGYLANAQQGYKYLGFRAGWITNKAYVANINIDFANKTYSSYELFAEFYNKEKKGYKSYMGGLVYKPTLCRNKNSLLKLRLGAGLGSGNKNFIAAPQLGLEFSQTIIDNVDLLLVNRNQFVFFDQKSEQSRIGFEIGLRFPL